MDYLRDRSGIVLDARRVTLNCSSAPHPCPWCALGPEWLSELDGLRVHSKRRGEFVGEAHMVAPPRSRAPLVLEPGKP